MSDGAAPTWAAQTRTEPTGGPREHLDQLAARFDDATERIGVHEAWMAPGGIPIRVLVAGDQLADLFLPSLRTLSGRPDPGTEPAFTIRAFDTASSGVRVPPPPWGTDAYLARDEIAGSGGGGVDAAYAVVPRVLTMFDRAQRSGLWWAADHRQLPPWEQGAPFRNVLNWGLAANRLQMAHAAAIGRGADGLLLVGRGGVGKSTTTMACVTDGWRYVADDYCALAVEGLPTAHSLFGVGKMDAASQDRFPDAFPIVRNPDRPPEDKAIVDVARCYPDQMASSLRLRAVVLPTLAERPPGLTPDESAVWPARPVDAGRALVPSTLLQLPGCHPETGATMSLAIDGLPVFALAPGRDMGKLSTTLTSLLRDVLASESDSGPTPEAAGPAGATAAVGR